MSKDQDKAGFWDYVGEMHLYDNCGEGFVKACVFIISLFVGVYPLTAMEGVAAGRAYLAFCLSLMVEYGTPLFLQRASWYARLLKFVIVVIALVIFISATALFSEVSSYISPDMTETLASVAVGIITVDALVHLMTGTQPHTNDFAEHQLSKTEG